MRREHRSPDWSAGIPACMSVASTRKSIRGSVRFDAAEATALQARMPAVQSHPPSAVLQSSPIELREQMHHYTRKRDVNSIAANVREVLQRIRLCNECPDQQNARDNQQCG